ncbi:hypothetical protein D9M70_224650 [compost metagenome]
MVRAPPDFRGQVVPGRAQRLHRGGEQQRLAHRHHLRPEALLARLGPEGGEVRRDHHAGDDLRLGLAERGNLRGEVIGQALEAPRIDQLEALLRQHRREAQLAVAPGVAVAVVGEQPADHLVAAHAAPHGGVGGDHVFQAPEEVVGPLETFLRLAATGEEPGLPGRHGGDAGDFVDLALVRHRVGGFRGGRHQHQVDAIGKDQFVGHFGGTVGVGLAVLDDHLQAAALAAHGNAVLQHRRQALDDVGVRGGKGRQRPGLGADVADADDLFRRQQRGRRKARQQRATGHDAARPQEITPGEPGTQEFLVVVHDGCLDWGMRPGAGTQG